MVLDEDPALIVTVGYDSLAARALSPLPPASETVWRRRRKKKIRKKIEN
jgi:hypothetical protein